MVIQLKGGHDRAWGTPRDTDLVLGDASELPHKRLGVRQRLPQPRHVVRPRALQARLDI